MSEDCQSSDKKMTEDRQPSDKKEMSDCRCCGKDLKGEGVYDEDVRYYFCSEDCRKKWKAGLVEGVLELDEEVSEEDE